MPRRPTFPWKVRTETGGPPRRGPLVNQIVAVANWLRGALQLKGDEVPSNLLLPDVQPVIDVYQRGFPRTRWFQSPFSLTAGAPSVLQGPPDGFDWWITYLDGASNAWAAARTVFFSIRRNTTATGPVIFIDPAFAANTVLDSTTITQRAIFIPDGFHLFSSAFTLVAAEVFNVRLQIGEVPAGSGMGGF